MSALDPGDLGAPLSSIEEIPQNPIIGALARLLGVAQSAAQKVPHSMSSKALQLLLGSTPQTVENYSYGFPPPQPAGPLAGVNPQNFELTNLLPQAGLAKAVGAVGAKLAPLAAMAAGVPLGGKVPGTFDWALQYLSHLPKADAYKIANLAHVVGEEPLLAENLAKYGKNLDEPAVFFIKKHYLMKPLTPKAAPKPQFTPQEIAEANIENPNFSAKGLADAGYGPEEVQQAFLHWSKLKEEAQADAAWKLQHPEPPQGGGGPLPELKKGEGVYVKDLQPSAPAGLDLSNWLTKQASPLTKDDLVMAKTNPIAVHAGGTQLILKDDGYYLTNGQNSVGPHPTPESAIEGYNTHYALKQGKVLAGPSKEPVALDMSDPAVKLLAQRYDISPAEIQLIYSYEPSLTPAKILERYDTARYNMESDLGMTAGQYRDPDIRARESGAMPYNLARGSHRANPTPVPPQLLPESSSKKTHNTTGESWPHPYIFASEYDPAIGEGSTYFDQYKHKLKNLRAIVPEEKLLRPDWIQAHPTDPMTYEFEHVYDFLKDQEASGLRQFPKEYQPQGGGPVFKGTGKQVMDQWRQMGHGAGFSQVERQDVALTLQQMGLRGFTTHEAGGRNFGLMHDVPLRWYKAPFDPRKKSIPGYFFGLGGAAAGVPTLMEMYQQALEGDSSRP